MMAGPTSPLIKDEPDDFNHMDPNRFMPNHANGSNHNGNHQFGHWENNNNIDPSDLSMSGSMLQPTFGSQQNLSSSYIAGRSGIADDELLDLVNLSGDPSQGQGNHFQRGHIQQESHYTPVSHTQNAYMQTFSETPEGAPIQSPFMHGFNYNQWQPSQSQQRQSFAQQAATPGGRARHSIQSIDRTGSVSRSPMTPGMGNLQLGTPETNSVPGHAIHGAHMNRGHARNMSSQWDDTPGSGHSYLDSPLSSPNAAMHPQISEVLTSGKHASLPTKVEPGTHGRTGSTLEAKRQKRRESHNAVERRRRNNINDRIQELSRLVPQHRLEDDAIRRHIVNGSSLPPSIAGNGMSPPQATSLLAGGTGRRAAGTITQGFPIDEKDKGPAKGDVLNGAVGWTRDLMWFLHHILQRETAMRETIERLGGQFPLQMSEEEERMRSELATALQKNDAAGFVYSRHNGSGLWVPGFTDHTGLPNGASQSSSSPGAFQNVVHGNNNGNNVGNHEQQFWGFTNDSDHGRNSIDFKDEVDFGMEMN